MELSTILTYIGLLLTAYGATQEHIRLELRLAPKIVVTIFFLTLIILYICTLEFVRNKLIIHGFLQYSKGLGYYFWDAKYLIILTINFISLWFIVRASKLTPRNQRAFLDLVHELRGYKNYAILHKLIKRNLEKIFSLRYKKTFAEKASFSGFGKDFDRLYAKLGMSNFFTNKNANPLQKLWNRTVHNIYQILSKFSFQKDMISEITQYTISDKTMVKTIAENNEPLGLDILRQILKYKASDIGFADRFLITVFKNRDSYIYKEYIKGGSGKVFDFIHNNQKYEGGLDIGLNLSFAILELLEDNPEFLHEYYDRAQLKPLFKHISELFEALGNTDPAISHYSNLPYYIGKTLLENIDLEEEEQSVGFYFLNSLFLTFVELNAKCNGTHISVFNSLFSSFIDQSAEGVKPEYLIRIGCKYIDYMFNDRHFEHIDDHVSQFKESITQSWKSEKTPLCEMYLMVLNKRRRGGTCGDWIAYTHGGVNTKISEYWDSITEFLQQTIESERK